MDEHAVEGATDYDFPEVPETESALREAYRALQRVVAPGITDSRQFIERSGLTPEDMLEAPEVLAQFPSIAARAERVVDAQVGPCIGWADRPLRRGEPFRLVLAGVDLDGGDFDFGVKLGSSAYGDYGDDWSDSALGRAASAYRKEAGWDFAPGSAGIWLLMLAPRSAMGASDGDDDWSYYGNLAAFVILYDRDEDGDYENIAHIWTAAAWRRRGIARQLVGEAGRRFGAVRAEGPFSDDGESLLRACGLA